MCLTVAALGLLLGRAGRTAAGALYRVEPARLAAAPAAAKDQVFVPDGPVDLNTATLAQLMGLPGIGETRAQAILDYRAANGPFAKPEDLVLVSGIGDATYALAAPYITVSTP